MWSFFAKFCTRTQNYGLLFDFILKLIPFKIDLSKKFLKEKNLEIPENSGNIIFEILLENKYPFIFPKVTCKTTVPKIFII